MPQLSIETFVTQYFWLLVFLFNNYIWSATLYLPTFSSIFETRNRLQGTTSTEKVTVVSGKKIWSSTLVSRVHQNINKIDNKKIFIDNNISWVK